MGLDVNGDGKFLGLRVVPRHKRSKSFPDKRRVDDEGSGSTPDDSTTEISPRSKLDMGRLKACSFKAKTKLSLGSQTQTSLKGEILHLERRLQDQIIVHRALENALGRGSSTYDANDLRMPKPATELIKEIAVLELEVSYLEQYLLTLYRKAFDQQLSSVSPITKHQVSPTIKDQVSPTIQDQVPPTTKHQAPKSPWNSPRRSPLVTPRRLFMDDAASIKDQDSVLLKPSSKLVSSPRYKQSDGFGPHVEDKLFDSTVHQNCRSTLSQRYTHVTQMSPMDSPQALRACQSQPLSMSEYVKNMSSNVVSLAEHLGAHMADHIPETPNRISEDMVKCMAAIFCKLSEPPSSSINNGLSSPNSSSSSMGAFSPRYHGDASWSPGCGKDSSFDVRLDNPFNVEGLKEFSGPYSAMVEVPCIYRDNQKLSDIDDMMQNFRSLIYRLQEIDPKKMNHEEKLAFWINIHNSLVMHAYLAYGIPQNNVKRVFLLLKAAYNIGGHTISADTIQTTILGCRMSRPGQWLRILFSPKSKFKTGDKRQAYSLDHPEPLLHFALCSGSHSDPALRAYTPKRVYLELESAKEEYIRATFGVRKDQKALLPKVVESYSKDAGLCPAGIIEMIQQSLPDSSRKSLKKCQLGKSRKSIEWVPHNFSFRYLILKELVK